MKKITLAILVVCFAFAFSYLKANDKTKIDSTLVYTFLDIFEKDGISTSLDYLFITNNWIEKSTIDTLKLNLNKVLNSIGPYYGYSLIKKTEISDCLVTYSFVLRYASQPIRFAFVFYKPNDRWQIQSFNYDSDIIDEMLNSKNVTWD